MEDEDWIGLGLLSFTWLMGMNELDKIKRYGDVEIVWKISESQNILLFDNWGFVVVDGVELFHLTVLILIR